MVRSGTSLQGPRLPVPSARLTERYQQVRTYTDLHAITWKQIERFFLHYRDHEPGKWARLAGGDADDAPKLLETAISRAAIQNSR